MARDAVHLQVLADDQWKKVKDLRDYMGNCDSVDTF